MLCLYVTEIILYSIKRSYTRFYAICTAGVYKSNQKFWNLLVRTKPDLLETKVVLRSAACVFICFSMFETSDACVACSFVFTWPFSNYRVRSFRLSLITQERFGLATWNFDNSLRLISCMFVRNFEVISHVILVLRSENRPEVWSK